MKKRKFAYATVSNDKEIGEQVSMLFGYLDDGFKIISAAGNAYAIHYVLERSTVVEDLKK